MATVHARPWARWRHETEEWPIRNRGRAAMRPKAPALPAHCTSMRRAPRTARATTAADTSASLTATARPTQRGAEPSTRMATTAAPSRTRSAVGSSTLPTVDTWSRWRAA